jgi:serine/threonine protein kinase
MWPTRRARNGATGDSHLARYIGHYKIIRELGSGHFGTVYLAVGEVPGRRGQPPRNRVVAVKKLKQADARAVRLLTQEFALLDQVKHRCVVRVFEYLEDENAVVMEYIHGVSLRQMLDELEKAREQVFTEAAIEIASEIADALYQACTTPADNGEPLQLVHRDLKPANIMLTPGGEVRVLDWGLARVDNADFRPEDRRRIRGTLLYMAPEQAQGLEIDHRTDLFALGLILYELLEGKQTYQVPADSTDPVGEVKELIRLGDTRQACAQLETRLPSIGPIITQCLQARPEDRYRSGQDMMVDLRRQLYRDRGAYLEEFCEFFFGSIHDIGDPVSLDSLGPDSAMGQRSRDRVSIEERLRQSMAQDDQVQERVQTTPGRGAGGPPVVPRSSSPPSVPSGRERPARPSGASDLGPGVKRVGQRSPEETGMLEMVPLSGTGGPIEGGQDPSATAFFAIPAPKSDRGTGGPPGASKPSGPPPPPGGPPRPPAPPPRGGPPPVAAPPLVRGPVAPSSTGTPFQVTGNTPTAGDNENRVNSSRVFAIVFAAFLLVCMALVLAFMLGGDGKKERSAERSSGSDGTTSGVAATGGSGGLATDTGSDGGTGEEESSTSGNSGQGASSTTGRSTGRSSSGSSSSGTGRVSSGTTTGGGSGSGKGLVLRLKGAAAKYTKVSGSCGGESLNGPVSGGTIRLSSVRRGSSCSLSFKGGGGSPGKATFTVSKGDMSCSSLPGGVMDCK